MRKNQKYTKEEMYLAIEIWQESGLSQYKYCKQEGMSRNTFKYWLNKYRNETGKSFPTTNSFIPVHLSQPKDRTVGYNKQREITITYPNGTEVNCPVDAPVQLIKALISA